MLRGVTILTIVLWIVALGLFLGLYAGFHAPFYEIVVPVIGVVGIAVGGVSSWAVEMRAPFTPAEKRQLKQAIIKYLAVKDKVRGPKSACPPSPLQNCLAQARSLPEGSERGMAFAQCQQAKTSDRKECEEVAQRIEIPHLREEAFDKCKDLPTDPRLKYATRAPECAGLERAACLEMMPFFHPHVHDQMSRIAVEHSEDDLATFCSNAATAALMDLELQGY
jgi:hypothetical protein